MKRLREEQPSCGRSDLCEVLRAFEPRQPKTISYMEAATRLGMTESAVKARIHRMRERHRRIVREEIAQTVATSDEIDEELWRSLKAVVEEIERKCQG